MNTRFVPRFSRPPLVLPRVSMAVLRWVGIGLGAFVLFVVLGIGTFFVIYHNRIYPRVTVGGIGVGGLTQQQAQAMLAEKFSQYTTQPLMVISADRTWKIDPSTIGLSYNATASANRAFQQGRSSQIGSDVKIILGALIHRSNVAPKFHYDANQYNNQLSDITQAITVTPQSSKISYVDSQFIVAPSITGVAVDTHQLNNAINTQLTTFATTPIVIPTKTVQPALTADKAQQIVPALTQYVQNPLTLTYNDKRLTISIDDLLNMIDYEHTSSTGFSLSEDKLSAVIADFAQQINQPAKNALFQYQDGKVSAFQASQNGIAVDTTALTNQVEQTLLNGGASRVIAVPVKTTLATVTTDSVNDLGIKELIGHGESNYRGSPADRIFNLTLATKRLNGALVAPGAEFSFNQTVGEISQASGYEQGLVILAGRTVLGDGGGVCQVSTTLFRAVLNSGLPVTARTAHSYRVGYYENDMGPGFDATIYQPGVDFKFKNDTGHYILIQASTDPAVTKINIDIYGTSDGRTVTLSKPVILSTTPAPPDIHQQDPTMPAGTSKQVEHSIPGAKVVFYRKVVRNGETLINESFTSNYVPWAAVFIDGTGPATSPAPQGT